MNEEELKEKVELAKSAVSGLEEPLKTEGFKTILDKLLSGSVSGKKPKKTSKKRVRRKVASNGKTKKMIKGDEKLKTLLQGINRTEYPKMYEIKNTLGRSLYLLQIAKNKFAIDGLVTSQIAKILTDIFRIKTTGSAISMSLMDEKLKVDRVQISRPGTPLAYAYRLMSAGEVFLKSVLESVSEVEVQNGSEEENPVNTTE